MSQVRGDGRRTTLASARVRTRKTGKSKNLSNPKI
jgi:hypothetical protein